MWCPGTLGLVSWQEYGYKAGWRIAPYLLVVYDPISIPIPTFPCFPPACWMLRVFRSTNGHRTNWLCKRVVQMNPTPTLFTNPPMCSNQTWRWPIRGSLVMVKKWCLDRVFVLFWLLDQQVVKISINDSTLPSVCYTVIYMVKVGVRVGIGLV